MYSFLFGWNFCLFFLPFATSLNSCSKVLQPPKKVKCNQIENQIKMKFFFLFYQTSAVGGFHKINWSASRNHSVLSM